MGRQRCETPWCVLAKGHALRGERYRHPQPCRPVYQKDAELCGAWMPHSKEPCARMAGHADTHRSRYALDNNRDANWYRVAS